MHDQHVWDAWCAALADRSCPLTIANCQRYRRASWHIGPRSLSYHMLHVIERGGQSGRVGDRRIETAAGDVLWVPAGTAQDLLHRTGSGVLVFSNLRFTLAGADPPALPYVMPHVIGARSHLAELRREWLSDLPGREGRLRAMLVLLFSDIWRSLAAPNSGLDPAMQERVLRLVEADPTGRPDMGRLAAALGLSPARFSRLFRRTYGCAPRSWLVRHRIQVASGHLTTDGSISAVASRFGYKDIFLFSRQFKLVTGVSPRAWLRQHGS